MGMTTPLITRLEEAAVAWRVRTSDGKGGFLIEATDVIENGLTHWKECGWTVQPLYTHPAPIKPSVDTGELRERVARKVCCIVRTWQGFKGTPKYTLDMEVENAWDDWLTEADAILDLIQSERAGSPIGQNDQRGLAFSDAGEP